ncbi:MAG: hypothetical protein ABW006_03885 [Hyphomicrobium sp.]
MASFPSDRENPRGRFKRRLRAAFSADIANFSGNVSVSETRAFGNLADVLEVGREELDRYEGVLLGVPGDGLFGLFESVVNAVHCAISIQERLAADVSFGKAMRFRIGVHLGDVLFDGDVPFGETLNIATRLQALADPGGTLVSGAVVDAVSARISAHFEARGVPQLKNIPRRIATFAVYPRFDSPDPEERSKTEPLDHTMQLPSRKKPAVTVPPANDYRIADDDPMAMFPTVEEPASPPRVDPPPASKVAAPSEVRDPGPVSSVIEPVSAVAEPIPAPVSRAPRSALDVPLTPDVVAFLGEAISEHLGPVGRVMSVRKSKSCTSIADLFAALEKEIPSLSEQHAFRSRVKRRLEP